jgi:hypothetical protein
VEETGINSVMPSIRPRITVISHSCMGDDVEQMRAVANKKFSQGGILKVNQFFFLWS